MALHAGPADPQGRPAADRPLGAGVLIDRWRVLTCASVLGEPDRRRRPVMGRLSQGRRAWTVRRRVVSVRVDAASDIAVLVLAEPGPAGRATGPAVLPGRCRPGGRGLVGVRLPGRRGVRVGRLGLRGLRRCPTAGCGSTPSQHGLGLTPGFLGAGVWSPRFEAVVGRDRPGAHRRPARRRGGGADAAAGRRRAARGGALRAGRLEGARRGRVRARRLGMVAGHRRGGRPALAAAGAGGGRRVRVGLPVPGPAGRADRGGRLARPGEGRRPRSRGDRVAGGGQVGGAGPGGHHRRRGHPAGAAARRRQRAGRGRHRGVRRARQGQDRAGRGRRDRQGRRGTHPAGACRAAAGAAPAARRPATRPGST